MSATPKVETMLLCDRVRRDPDSGKWCLDGVWEWGNVESVPAVMDFECYVILTGLFGSYDFQVAIVAPDEEKEIARYSLGAQVTATDPRRRLQLGFTLSSVRLPKYGEYTIRLLHNGKPLNDFSMWLLPEGKEPYGY